MSIVLTLVVGDIVRIYSSYAVCLSVRFSLCLFYPRYLRIFNIRGCCSALLALLYYLSALKDFTCLVVCA